MSTIPNAELGQTAKGKLLKSATDLFNEKGYASTSVREIVEAAGVTKPALYHHFESKEGLFLEILTTALRRFEERLERQVEALRKSVELSTIRYKGGLSNYLDVLIAERNLYGAEQGLARTRGKQLNALVAIYLALGGGWKQ